LNNEVGTFDYITEDYILAGAKQKLGLRDTTLEDSYLKELINECVGTQLRNAATRVQIVTQLAIERVGGVTPRAKLPKGFIRLTKLLPIVYVNASGNAINGVTNGLVTTTNTTSDGELLGNSVSGAIIPYLGTSSPVYINTGFFENSPYGDNNLLGGIASVQDGYIYFSRNISAEFVKVAYLGVKQDENGSLMIPALCGPAIEAYACWCWCLTNFTTHGQVGPTYERIWIKQKRTAKANFNLPDSLEYSALNRTMNSLI
jgi:hypothetical protein